MVLIDREQFHMRITTIQLKVRLGWFILQMQI